MRAAFAGAVVSVNEQAMRDTSLVNADCYGAGWMLLVRPASEDWRAGLVTGAAIADAYEAWMESEAYPGCGQG